MKEYARSPANAIEALINKMKLTDEASQAKRLANTKLLEKIQRNNSR
jgi:hypothetical protein